MPIKQSAIKALRQSEKKRKRNKLKSVIDFFMEPTWFVRVEKFIA